MSPLTLSPYERRPLRDLGAYLTLLLAPLLLAMLNHGDAPEEKSTREEVVQVVRYPDDGTSAAFGAFLRVVAWMMVTAAGLAVFIPTAMIRADTGTWLHPLPLTVMTVSTTVGTYASGAILVGCFRSCVAWLFEKRLDRRFDAAVAAGRRPRGLLVRLGLPSHLDMVLAALWALMLTVGFYEQFVTVPT